MSEQQGMSSENGDEAAMPADLCDRLTAAIPAVRRFALSLSKDRDEAADLVQETCLRALAFWHQWHPGSNFESWLFQITRNLWIDRIRSRQSRERTIETVQQIGATFVDGQRVMEQRLTLGSIREILPRLPQEQQDILLSVAVEGLSYKDASARLSMPIGTVMSRLSRARRALHNELGGSLTIGLILAILLPFLDREALAGVKDPDAVNGDLEGPLANGLLMAPFLPMPDRDGRGESAGSWITGMPGKALSAVAREMEGGVKGLQRADVAASLFFLLLVDLVLADQAGTQQLRGLFERAVGEPGRGPDNSRLALEDDDSVSGLVWTTPEGDDHLGASGAGERHPQGGSPLAEITQDPDQQGPLAAEALPAMEQASAVFAEPTDRQIADASSKATQSAGLPVANQASDALLHVPTMEALARAGDGSGPDQLSVSTLSTAGVTPPGGPRATGPEDLGMAERGPAAMGKEFSALHESGAAAATIAFVLGQRIELGDDDPQDHWAALLRNLLSDDDMDEGVLFEDGEGTLPAVGYWDIAGSEEPVTIGELLDMTGDDPVLTDLFEHGGEAAPQMAIGFEPQRAEQVATQLEPEPFDPLSVSEVQTDVS